MIAFDKETCTDFETALSKEWLETNGLGGFASSTIIGCNTRRYHGLLVAANQPPLDRMVLVNSLEEQVIIGGTRYDLSCHQYPRVVFPRGDQNLVGFSLDPWPVWTYRVHQLVLEKTLTMIHGQNTVVLTYKLRTDSPDAELIIRPFLTGRPFHQLHQENTSLKSESVVQDGVVSVQPYEGVPTLFMHHNAKRYSPAVNWYRQLEYARESERGLDFREDCWSPGEFSFTLRSGESAVLVLTTEGEGFYDAGYLLKQERQRRKSLLSGWEAADDVTQHLVSAADQFLVRDRNGHPDLIAGYPWFECWGRDTFIALPGLLLVTQRYEEARSILEAYVPYIHNGMLPNRLPEGAQEPEYNSVDASLWYIVAIFHYLRYTRDFDFVGTVLWPAMQDIVNAYQKGTAYNIHMEMDGLLFAGHPGVQLTWMDSKIGDWVVTPRTGKAIEIQALWYNALRIMQQVADHLDEKNLSKHYEGMAEKAWGSINRQFWNEEAGYLYDVINADQKDGTLRPNQIFAISLPFESVSPDRAQKILDVLEDRLLTPFGLRTLDPKDSRYAARYEGDVKQRDSAYHQGTVWPWMMGPFLSAYQKAYGKSAKSQGQIRAHLALLLTHLWEGGLGHISEIFDADMPHEPRGCTAQAWSVAEVLRVLREELGPPMNPYPIRNLGENRQPSTSGAH